jgi:hypothetical protein
MFKPFLFVFCCFSTCCCFAQSLQLSDSIPTTAVVNTIPEKIVKTEDYTSVKIYPNPAKNKISLQVQGFEPGIAQVKITDTKGKLCRQDNRLLTNGQEEIAMFLSLMPGIYFISINQKDKVVKKKLVIF